jgi:MFS family permease
VTARPAYGAPAPYAASTLVLFGATLLAFVAVGAALPTLSPYVRGPLHSSDLAAGIVVGCYAATSVVARPFAGRFADRRGRREVFIAGGALMCLGGLVYLLAANVPELVLGRLIAGAGEGTLYTAAAAWTVDVASAGREGLALGRFGLAVWGGLAIGPLIGSLLRASVGYDSVWIVAATLPLVAIAIVWRLAEPARRAHRDSEPHPLIPRATWIPGTALLLGNVGYGALAGFAVLFLDSQGIGGGAAVFTAFAASVVLSRLVLAHVPDRIGPRRGGTLAATLEAAGFLVIALSHSLASAIVGAVIVGLGFSLLFPALALLVVTAVPEDGRGAAMGSFSAFFDAGVGIGAPIAGLTATLAGYSAVFVMGAAASALGALITVAFGYSGRRLPRTS